MDATGSRVLVSGGPATDLRTHFNTDVVKPALPTPQGPPPPMEPGRRTDPGSVLPSRRSNAPASAALAVVPPELAADVLDATLSAVCGDGTVDKSVCNDERLLCSIAPIPHACPHRCGACASTRAQPATTPSTETPRISRTTTPPPRALATVVATTDSTADSTTPSVTQDASATTTAAPADRCTKEGCALLFPGPELSPARSLSDLVQFNGTCLWQHIPSENLPPSQRFDELRSHEGGTVPQCIEACVLDRLCTGYVHYGAGGSRGGRGRCTMYRGIKMHGFEVLKPRPDMKHCTAGIVRPGFPELDFTEPEPKSLAAALRELPKASLGQGHLYSVLDVHHCAAYGNATGRYALVLADDLQRPTQAMVDAVMKTPNSPLYRTMRGIRKVRNFVSDPKQAELARVARLQGLEPIKLLPDAATADFPLTPEERTRLEEDGYRIVLAPWVIPPEITYGTAPCAKQDFIRLNALALDEYDAVLVLDSDVTFYGDVRPILRCASRNFMLSTSGPLSPMNLGVWAFKPSAGLRDTAVAFGKTAVYQKRGDGGSQSGGWSSVGFAPAGGEFVGAACGQGFVWTLFYKNGHRNTSTVLDKVWRESAVPRPRAYQLDRCRWNFQGERTDKCDPSYICSETRLSHKQIQLTSPTKDNQNGRGCFYQKGSHQMLLPP